MKILITGGAGFIGSQLYTFLKSENHEVKLLDNMSDGYYDNITFEGLVTKDLIEEDIRKIDYHFLNEFEIVIHLAGISALPKCQINPSEAYDNNLTGYANILEGCRRSTKVRRIIFSSTSAVYENNIEVPFKEDFIINPDLIYSCTKQAGEILSKSYANLYDMDIIVARFFNVYGEHQDIHREMPPFMSYLAKEIFYKKDPIIYNKSSAKRDYVHVSDVIDCLNKMIFSSEKYYGEIFNICSGNGYTVPEIIRKFSDILEIKINPIFSDPSMYWEKFKELYNFSPISKERLIREVNKNSIGDPTKSKKEFGFEANYDFTNGIKKIIEFSNKTLLM